MIIIRLRGGLGNQMFQYAFAMGISEHLKTDFVLDLSSLLKRTKGNQVTDRDYQLHIFNVKERFLISPILLKILYKYHLNFVVQIIKSIKKIGIRTIREKTFQVDHNLLKNIKNRTLYTGYWQSEKYFENAEHELRKQYTFESPLSENAQVFLKAIKTSNSVCVHIRRGDYVLADSFNLSDISYFEDAAKYIEEKLEAPHFFIFSDEPDWCMEHIKLKYPFTIVDYNTTAIRYKEDLELMSSCDHFIMSASSFSWWAVWLRNNKNGIVITPKDWFINDDKDVSDLVNPNWIRL